MHRIFFSGCYPAPSPNLNPLALGTRWLAYADRKVCGFKDVQRRAVYFCHCQNFLLCVISGPKANDNYGLFSEGKTNSATLKDFLSNCLTVCSKL